MFGKRKHSSQDSNQDSAGQSSGSGEAEGRAETARASTAFDAPGLRSARPSGEAADSPQAYEPKESQRPRGPSRPDASAVLGRQPTPPVMPETPRRATDYGTARRAPERRQADREEGERLIVGRNISLSGEIKTCEKLVVEGEVDAELTDSRSLEITESGLFKGKAFVDEVEVAGNFEGELTARNRLYVRASGRLSGHIRYGELEIERGGRIAGTIEELEQQDETAADNKKASQEAPDTGEEKTPEKAPEKAAEKAADKSSAKSAEDEAENRDSQPADKSAESGQTQGANGNGAKGHDASANGVKESEETGKEKAAQPNGAHPAESQKQESTPKSTAASG